MEYVVSCDAKSHGQQAAHDSDDFSGMHDVSAVKAFAQSCAIGMCGRQLDGATRGRTKAFDALAKL